MAGIQFSAEASQQRRKCRSHDDSKGVDRGTELLHTVEHEIRTLLLHANMGHTNFGDGVFSAGFDTPRLDAITNTGPIDFYLYKHGDAAGLDRRRWETPKGRPCPQAKVQPALHVFGIYRYF